MRENSRVKIQKNAMRWIADTIPSLSSQSERTKVLYNGLVYNNKKCKITE